MRRFGFALLVMITSVAFASACEGKKDPLVPDNPNADPLMMDGGAPPAASSAAPN
jgi:hypothetical protein